MLRISIWITCLFKLVVLRKEFPTRMDFCTNEKCNDMLQDLNIKANIDNNPKKMYRLHSAPCPPPWDMSVLFDPSLCLTCEERIYVLNRCLSEWRLDLDCDNIRACENCVYCDICTSEDGLIYTAEKETTTIEYDIHNNEDPSDGVIAVSVTLVFATIMVLLVVFVMVKRKRVLANRQNDSENVDIESKHALKEKIQYEKDKDDDVVTDKLLGNNVMSERKNHEGEGT